MAKNRLDCIDDAYNESTTPGNHVVVVESSQQIHALLLFSQIKRPLN